MLQEMLGGRAQLRLFPPVHALRRGSVVFSSARPHLDEDDRALLLHDEIDLAKGTTIVARDERETRLLEIFGRLPLGGRAVPSLSE